MRKRDQVNLWLNYPLGKAMRFMAETEWEVCSHVLRIGPVAFCVLWKSRKAQPGAGAAEKEDAP